MTTQRITVDGSSHPIHDDATGVRVYLRDDEGLDCEVQVVYLNGELAVSIGGDVVSNERRGFLHLRVRPNQTPVLPF